MFLYIFKKILKNIYIYFILFHKFLYSIFKAIKLIFNSLNIMLILFFIEIFYCIFNQFIFYNKFLLRFESKL